jgi:transcriptional regulator with XRE-family HTH domain
MNVGSAIKEIRKSKGMNQVDLANAAGITQAALSGI